jgi:hypothetical protein
MLVEALVFSRVIGAEFFKTSHRPGLLFWGFFFVPLISFATDLVLLANPLHIGSATRHIDLVFLLSRSLEISSSPLAQVFFIAGAAVIFGTEYESETWRLIAPRAPRTLWIMAKASVYGTCALMSLTLVALGSICRGLLGSVSQHLLLTWETPGTTALFTVGAVFGISWLELLFLGAITGLIAVVSRSVLVAALSVTLFAFCQSVLISWFRLTAVAGRGISSTIAMAFLPDLSAEVARFFAIHAELSPGRYVASREGFVSVLSLCSGMALTIFLTAVWFRNQELSRE